MALSLLPNLANGSVSTSASAYGAPLAARPTDAPAETGTGTSFGLVGAAFGAAIDVHDDNGAAVRIGFEARTFGSLVGIGAAVGHSRTATDTTRGSGDVRAIQQGAFADYAGAELALLATLSADAGRRARCVEG